MTGCCSQRQVRISVPEVDAFLALIRGISDRWNSRVVFIGADRVAGRDHVQAALNHALRAEAAGTMISSRFEMEVLLYASGSRQIVHGSVFGLHPGENRAYLCLCPDSDGAWKELAPLVAPAGNENWEEIPPEKANLLMELFSITAEELSVVGPDRMKDLVLERVVLLEDYR